MKVLIQVDHLIKIKAKLMTQREVTLDRKQKGEQVLCLLAKKMYSSEETSVKNVLVMTTTYNF